MRVPVMNLMKQMPKHPLFMGIGLFEMIIDLAPLFQNIPEEQLQFTITDQTSPITAQVVTKLFRFFIDKESNVHLAFAGEFI